MEIFGGFMVMMSILSFFMAVVWLIMPFVVFTIKGKLDRTLELLDRIDKRLAEMEAAQKASPQHGGRNAEVNGPAPLPSGPGPEDSSSPLV